MEFEEQNKFEKELEKRLPEAKTLKEQLETKREAYVNLITRLQSRLNGYKTLLKELVKLEQKATEEDDKETKYQINIFEVRYEFRVFAKEYVRTLEKIEKLEEERDEIGRQLYQLERKD